MIGEEQEEGCGGAEEGDGNGRRVCTEERIGMRHSRPPSDSFSRVFWWARAWREERIEACSVFESTEHVKEREGGESG